MNCRGKLPWRGREETSCSLIAQSPKRVAQFFSIFHRKTPPLEILQEFEHPLISTNSHFGRPGGKGSVLSFNCDLDWSRSTNGKGGIAFDKSHLYTVPFIHSSSH